MKTAVISFNFQGNIIAKKLQGPLSADLYSKNNTDSFNIYELAGILMKEYKKIIFISSTGIAVRAIAPHIKSKDVDPAVVVIDVFGEYAISLLSGHLGGANELAKAAAEIIGAEPIITTATDGLGVMAPDMIAKENELIIDDLKAAKAIAAMLLDDKKVAFIDEDKLIETPKGYCSDIEGAEGLVLVSSRFLYKGIEENIKSDMEVLKLIRRNIVLGIGCKKGYSSEAMKAKVVEKLREFNIDIKAVKAIATIDLKKNEIAILELADYLKAELKIFTKDEIEKIEHKYEGSSFVEKSVGVRAVCEPCTELCGAKLLTGKLSLEGMTLCIGKL